MSESVSSRECPGVMSEGNILDWVCVMKGNVRERVITGNVPKACHRVMSHSGGVSWRGNVRVHVVEGECPGGMS